MVPRFNLTIGFCLECMSSVIEIQDRYRCACGSLPKESAHLPATWSIPNGNIAPLVAERKALSDIRLMAKAASKAS